MKGKRTFAETIFQYKETWFRIAMGIAKNESDAEEIVCESILKAYEKRQTLVKENSFKSWMTGIVLHTAYDFVRQRGRVSYLPHGEENRIHDRACPSVEDEIIFRENKSEMWNRVCLLEEQFRIVVILYYYEEFSVKEIAGLLDISAGTVKSRLARARKKLFFLIQGEKGGEESCIIMTEK